MNDTEPTDLPQPGLDESSSEEAEQTDDAHPTEGPGNVSVDEPTETSLDPEAGDDDWTSS